MTTAMKGRYRDELRNPEGRLIWQSGWLSNRILHNCSRLLAALLKGEANTQGLLYWAIGEGERGWDGRMPNPQPANTRLTCEVHRLPLAGQVIYIDDQNEPSMEVTNRLEVTITIDGDTLVSSGFQPLREFGLFGCDATMVANSGLMINQVIHPRIDVAPGMRLLRTLHLTFAAEIIQAQVSTLLPRPPPPAHTEPGFSPEAATSSLILTGPRAALSTVSIDGVGLQYAAELAAAGVHTVSTLAQVDPAQRIGTIPEGKLREFRAKAKLVLGLPHDLGALSPLATVTVGSFLRQAAGRLVQGTASPDVAAEAVHQWQAQLESVQMALDEAHLQKMTLGELVSA
jgi:hypothetical protein